MKVRSIACALLISILALCSSCRFTHGPDLVALRVDHLAVTAPLAHPAHRQDIAAHAPIPPANPSSQKPGLSDEELKEYQPNEAGVVPILEYHEITSTEHWMSRSIEHFRDDLQRLYEEGYRPINLSEYLSGRIDLPLGASPVILTFDDARKSQYCFLPDGSLDPDCAIAILQEFTATHPDFPLKAMFFILPKHPFEQPNSGPKKVRSLLALGCEIGNHTLTHRLLHRLSDAQVQEEIGGGAEALHKMAPNARIDTIAFPGGHPPHHLKLAAEGNFHGFHYTNQAAFLAASSPAPSPVAKHQNRLRIEHILACEGECGITYWLDRMKKGTVPKYVSDGDLDTITVPRKFAADVDTARLGGAILRIY